MEIVGTGTPKTDIEKFWQVLKIECSSLHAFEEVKSAAMKRRLALQCSTHSKQDLDLSVRSLNLYNVTFV